MSQGDCGEVVKLVNEVERKLEEELLVFYERRPSSEVLSKKERDELAGTLRRYLGTLKRIEPFVELGCVNFSALNNVEEKIAGFIILLEKADPVEVSLVVEKLQGMLGWLHRIPSSPHKPEQRPEETKRPQPLQVPQVYVHVILEETGERTAVQPPFIIGRYDPPSSSEPSRLALREYTSSQQEFGRVLYVFDSTVSKYGCTKGVVDCTSRNHVKVLYEGGSIVVEHCGHPEVTRTYVISGGRQFTLRSGESFTLGMEGVIQLSGTYIERTKVPATLRLVLSDRPAGRPEGVRGLEGAHRFTKRGVGSEWTQ